jgi:hypothetical protein
MADLDKQTEEALGWAAEGKKLAVDIPEVSFKDAATFVAEMTPIVGDVMAAKEVYDELQKDEPNYYLAGALGGAALVGLVPGLGDAAAKAIKKGAKEVFDVAKRVEVDPNAMGSGLGNVQLKPKQPFKKTRSAYRIATQADDGKLYPLFVNASDEIPVGEWVSASVPPVTFKGANGNMYVPSRGAARSKGEKSKATGDMQTLPDQETADQLKAAGFSVEKPSKAAPFGKVRAVASRPGFHATTKPVAHHLGPEDLIITSAERNKLLKAGVTPKAFKAKTFNYLDGKLVGKKKVAELSAEDKKRVKTQKKYYVKRRAEDQVFVEVDMADDTSEDLLKYMQERNRTDINDKLPSGGSYTYQDGQADAETWVVGGDMKVNRVLSREEAKAAQEAAGVKDLPYRDEIEEILGRKFAKGGLVGEEDMYTGQQDSLIATGMADDLIQGEDDQTVRAFALGGLAEDVDPVSGNEVPTGSLPEEVRDDIPAQLSEGEYVVPADVVRFFGVKFFEDLRTEAKTGFNAMEANGRIGGEPIGMEMGGDELPFDISELQIVDDGEEEQPMMNKGGYISGYAPGGLVDTGDIPLTEENYQGTGMEQRQYSNAAGNIITILFFNGMPMSAVPDGYSPYTPEAVPSEAKETAPSDDDGGFDQSASDPEPIDYKGLSASELRDLVEAQKDTSRTAIALGLGMVNPLLGMAFKAATWHQSKQVTKELARRMEDPSLDAKQKAFYTDLTETMTADQPGLFERLFGKTEEAKKPELAPTAPPPVMTPEEVQAAMTDTPGVTEPYSYTPEAGYTPAATAAETAEVKAANDALKASPVPRTTAQLRKDKEDDTFFATKSAISRSRDIQKESEDTGKSIAEIGRESAPSTAPQSDDDKAAEEAGATRGVGGQRGMNKGGLMKKKKK